MDSMDALEELVEQAIAQGWVGTYAEVVDFKNGRWNEDTCPNEVLLRMLGLELTLRCNKIVNFVIV